MGRGERAGDVLYGTSVSIVCGFLPLDARRAFVRAWGARRTTPAVSITWSSSCRAAAVSTHARAPSLATAPADAPRDGAGSACAG
eukprot:3097213-Prymnesium_polylepis.1